MTISNKLFAALAASSCIAAIATPAQAQTGAQTRSYDIPAGDMARSLDAFTAQSGVQLVYRVDEVRGLRSGAVRGSYRAEEALRRLLAGSSLTVHRGGNGVYAVVRTGNGRAGRDDRNGVNAAAGPDAPGQGADETQGVPDILVMGRRDWSLNTGIERSRDDSQPFVVLTQEQIRRSGATNLEQFLRDYLTTNAASGTAEQTSPIASGNAVPTGLSTINLRGLGTRETLILVDGRRQAGVNTGSGQLEQSVITNIPLAAIERIEVLSSSAAGIYGAGASGGVVNIILRRDYRGRQLSLTYNDTTDFAAPDGRIALVIGQPLENGRTNVSLTASYRRSDPLLNNERSDLIVGARRFVVANQPDFYTSPPPGPTPNFRSTTGAPLRLDPAYGGTLLPAAFGFVPPGYRGVAADGVGPLVANIGQYNLELNDSASPGGGRSPLVFGVEQISGNLAVRRHMNSWLDLYAEAAGSIYNSQSIFSLAPSLVTLPANAPNNPFQQNVFVTFPDYGGERTLRSRNTQLRLIGGGIVNLPGDWRAVVDIGYNRNWYTMARAHEALSLTSPNSLRNGTFDVLSDSRNMPFAYEILPQAAPDLSFSSDNLVTSLKLAGPVPFALPGGRPTVALSLERNRESSAETFALSQNPTISTVTVTYRPERSQTLSSVYGEVRAPLIGPGNHVPGVSAFEIVVAARYEQYHGRGSNDQGYTCYQSPAGNTAPIADPISLCDPSTLAIPIVDFSNSHVDPTVSAKWTVTPDIAFRASYATGYLPPRLNNLVQVPGSILVAATDPQRGNEVVGEPYFPPYTLVPGFFGGNPDVRPERSETFTAGAILTPRFVPGLRFSVDYTRLHKSDVYYDPGALIAGFTGTVDAQTGFETFLRYFPERITRGPASGGFAVGPIIGIDASTVNLSGIWAEALDFAFDYDRPLWGGTISVAASATRNLKLASQAFPDSPVVDVNGTQAGGFSTLGLGGGNLLWKGNASVIFSSDRFSLGARARYFDGYYFNVDRSVYAPNASATVPSQTYVDVFGSYTINQSFALRAGVNNVLNKQPPYVANYYSSFGDPRLANFYLSLTANF